MEVFFSMYSSLAVAHPNFHEQTGNLILHLHRCPNNVVAIPQYPPQFPDLFRKHVAFRKQVHSKIASSGSPVASPEPMGTPMKSCVSTSLCFLYGLLRII